MADFSIDPEFAEQLEWIRQFVATVVPCSRRSTSRWSMPRAAQAAFRPSTMARAGLSGVEGVLWTKNSPVAC